MKTDLELIGNWKKVGEADLSCVAIEIKESITLPSVIVLTGIVGAGKTTFSKTFLSEWDVVSPTYSIINEMGDFLHADFYRLKSCEDFDHLELALYAEDKNYILIEWGIDYENEIKRELGDNFNYYQLRIEIDSKGDSKTRSYFLEKFD